MAADLSDISLVQFALVAAVAFFASIVGGVAGYGTGALLPLILVPIVGAERVVPIIAISSLFSNGGRALAFIKALDRKRALIVLTTAIPTCIVGAYGFTQLTGRGAMLVIGTMLVASVPARRFARRRALRLGDRGLALASAGYGVTVGGTTGAGVFLLSLLMAAGLEGAAVIATDAVISIVLSAVKLLVFGLVGVIDVKVLAMALLIGLVVTPGAFLAKAIVDRLPLHLHTAILDAVVLTGGGLLIFGALGG